MANPEHLEMLKKGAETWNEWREKKPDIKLDLREIDLKKADLRGVDLKNADLTFANLVEADLRGANLSKAKLSNATLTGANLSEANLSGADFKKTQLSQAVFTSADFSGVDFTDRSFSKTDFSGASLSNAKLIRSNLSAAKLSRANLEKADLSTANLKGAILTRAYLAKARLLGANLCGANLREAFLIEADLSKASLVEADLREAIVTRAVFSGADLRNADFGEARLIGVNLSAADLSGANCYKANFSMVDLSAARLFNTKLNGATLTGVRLWETQRAGWSIKGVACEYIFRERIGNEKSVYSPGEFERLYADNTIIKLFYKDGINPLEIATIPALIKHLENSHPGSGLRLAGIREDSGGVVVELTVENFGTQSPEELKQFKAELEAEAQQKAQYLRQALDEALQLKGQVQAYERVVGQLLSSQKPTYYLESGGIQMGDTYQNHGQTAGMGKNVNAHDNTFNQIANQFGQSIDLPTLAKQLAELRQEMAKRGDSSPQAAIAQGEAAKAEIAAKEGNTSGVVEHLKAAGEWTLDLAKEIGKDVVVAAIKQSMGMP